MPNSNVPIHAASSVEIEHKFLVEESFDPQPFFAVLRSLAPQHEATAEVRERYYAAAPRPTTPDGSDGSAAATEFILRHSSDAVRQRLTLKQRSRPGTDIEVRRELSLALDPTVGDQDDAVREMLALIHVEKLGELTKQLHAFDFADCEVVYYRAATRERTLCCVEFEALHTTDIELARAVLRRYEAATGFLSRPRERRSLFELLFGNPCSPSDPVCT